jgi:hypothetical protein
MALKRFEFPPMLGPAEDQVHGSPAWALRIANRLSYQINNLDRDSVRLLCSNLWAIVKEPIRPWDKWPEEAPCKTIDAFLQLASGKTYGQIHALVAKYQGDQDLTRELEAMKAASDVEHRGPGRPSKENGCNTTNLGKTASGKRSRLDVPHTLRRLHRERPDLLDRVTKGELSANAAAIEAGFRRKLTPFEQVMKLLPKLTEEERRQLRQLLDTDLDH